MAKYRADNAEKLKAGQAKYKAANPEKTKAAQAKYRAANPEKTKARMAKYRAANLEKTKADQAKYRAANPSVGIHTNISLRYKVSMSVVRNLVPQELIEVKLLQIQLHRLINARA